MASLHPGSKIIYISFAALMLFGCSEKKTSPESCVKDGVPPIVALCQTIGEGDTAALRAAYDDAYRILGNPNSPARDEALFIRFLDSLLSRSDLPEDVAARAEDKRHRALLNRPGTLAGDFRFVDRDGNVGTLRSFAAPQTMLIFYDPECPHCPEILEKIAADREVNAAMQAGMLKVLAVYTEGKRDMWEERKGELPDSWTVAYDLSGIVDSEIYDVPAMPTVYILDTDKRVLIKDMPW